MYYLPGSETAVRERSQDLRFIQSILSEINLTSFNKCVSAHHRSGTIKDARIASLAKKRSPPSWGLHSSSGRVETQ